jgi:hypothetical protein
MWKNYSAELRKYGRGANFPEAISQAAFALCTGCPVVQKIWGTNAFDNYDLVNKKRLQLKAVSVETSPSSFGPSSKWDILYWLDFYRRGSLDGSFDVYLIPDEIIYNMLINKIETFAQQQESKRRPRTNIRKLIDDNNIKPKSYFI